MDSLASLWRQPKAAPTAGTLQCVGGRGLSPDVALFRQIRAQCSLPVRCLMRPRAGDFLYTSWEIDLLCAQIEALKAAGADGFVIGALTPEGQLDRSAMQRLLSACDGKPVTLHRCIDVSRDLAETYRAAAELGVDTVLTSGGAANCVEGAARLEELLALRDALQGPEVLIGAGVNAGVIARLRGGDAWRPGFPYERQNAAGKWHAFPASGGPHGTARPGRMAHPTD